jgi:hypothetical protein
MSIHWLPVITWGVTAIGLLVIWWGRGVREVPSWFAALTLGNLLIALVERAIRL